MKYSSENIAAALFCPKRFREESLKKGQLLESLSKQIDSDFGLETDSYRTAMTAPVRRLQQKTQVFPLDVKASSRSRLTHSLEAQTYARLIALAIIRNCPELFARFEHQILLSVSTASVLHDIGNPPFGHFGEIVFRKWLSVITENSDIKSELGSGEKEDLCSFNGNAQGLRLSHSIQQLNLTFGQYASFMKVPFTVSELLSGQGTGQSSNGVRSDYYSWAYRNAGVYLCEKCLVDKIRECRGTKNRHPFVSIVEWADDLSYVLADLEDAFELGLIDRYDILHMCDKMKQMHELDSMSDLLSHRTVADIFIHEPSEALFYLRDVVANAYINDIAKATCSNIEQFIDQGEPDYSGGDYPGLTIVSMLHDYEKSKIYSCRDVERLEISGGAFLDGLLSAYEKLLYEDTETFQKELSGTGGDPLLKRLACRISRRHREAYIRACTLRDQSEMYARIRLILDYISGMTDTYAQAEYAMISGAGVRSI
ncbi:MAG: dNTP triphosphohydrolase [Succinivibrio sp.]|nr:dNTP triphosphohydrolase [Succinivibrio sp.]